MIKLLMALTLSQSVLGAVWSGAVDNISRGFLVATKLDAPSYFGGSPFIWREAVPIFDAAIKYDFSIPFDPIIYIRPNQRETSAWKSDPRREDRLTRAFGDVEMWNIGVRIDDSTGMVDKNVFSGAVARVFNHNLKENSEAVVRRAFPQGVHDADRCNPRPVLDDQIVLSNFISVKHSIGGLGGLSEKFRIFVQGQTNVVDTKKRYTGSRHGSKKHQQRPKFHPLLGIQILFGACCFLAGLYFIIDTFEKGTSIHPDTGAIRLCFGIAGIFGGILVAALAFFPT